MLSPLDQPESTRGGDALGRWSLARTIYDLIRNSPADWSLRIGVYGRWGEGKTTVLKFLETLCRHDNLHVVWFNPWAVGDTADLWASLSSTIDQELGRRILAPIPLKAQASKLLRRGESLVKVHDAIKIVYDIATPLLLEWFKVNKTDIEARLRSALKDQPLIIMIDDLDRANPGLVPHLLLGLREVFNLRQCAFILALDPTIIADTLPSVHPGWGNTSDFLEKIIDFPFWLPPPTRNDILRLARTQMTSIRVQVDSIALQEVADLLPENPRILKRFFRGLWRLAPVLERHDKDELRWVMLLLIELMKAAAPRVAERMFRNDAILDHLEKSTFHLEKSESREKGGEDETMRSLLTEVDALLSELKCDDTTSQTVRRLVPAFRERTPFVPGGHIKYWAQLDHVPPIFTWKEFREFLSKWAVDPTGARLKQLVPAEARKQEASLEAAYRELFEAALAYRGERIRAAADSVSEADLVKEMESASTVFTLVRVLVVELDGFGSDQPILPVSHFKLLYDQFLYWAHFRNHPKYVRARNEEKDLLMAAAQRATSLAVQLLEQLGFLHDLTPGFEPAQLELRKGVICTLVEQVVPTLGDRFSRKDGIKSLWGKDRHLVEKYLLFRSDLGFYTSARLHHLRKLAATAYTSQAIQENFLEFLRLLKYGLQKFLSPLSPEEMKPLLKDSKLIKMAWKAATAAQLQPRMLGDVSEIRSVLLKQGFSESQLPWPRWWPASARK